MTKSVLFGSFGFQSRAHAGGSVVYETSGH